MEEKTDFQSEDEALSVLSDRLQERYGEEFTCLGNAGVTDRWHTDEPMIYWADFAPATGRGKVFTADIDIWGGVTDAYGQYVFKDVAEARARAPLAGFGFIEALFVTLDPKGGTAHVWKEGDSLEDYMGDGSSVFDPCVVIDVYLSDGCTDEEQAAQVKECMDALYDVGFGIYVTFYTEDYSKQPGFPGLYGRKFAASPAPESRHDADFYLDEIKTQKGFARIDRENKEAQEAAAEAQPAS